MVASYAGRRALVAVGIGLMTMGTTGGPAGAVELPPVSVPDVTLPPVTLPVVTLPPVTLPPVTLPPVTVPDVDVDTTTPVTVAGTTTSTTDARPAPLGGAPPAAGTGGAAPAVPRPPRPAVTPSVPAMAAENLASPPLRTVATERARQFAFPFSLALLVLGFLAAQHRVGDHDPRLAAAPVDDDRRRFR